MTIERLNNPELPQAFDAIASGDANVQAQYMAQLVLDLQDEKLTDIHNRINLILQTQDDNIAYLGLVDETGDYPDGTWRINGSSSSELLIQLKIDGVWVTIDTIDAVTGIDLSGIVVYDDTVVCHNGEVVQV